MSPVTVKRSVRVLEDEREIGELMARDLLEVVIAEADKFAGPVTVTVTAVVEE